MKVNVVVPAVGESISEGFLASWHVEDETRVIEGQVIFEFETDKTSMDVTAPATGMISLMEDEGSELIIDQVVAVIDTEAQGRITPSAKAAAAKAGIDTSEITGSGRQGMITKADIPVRDQQAKESVLEESPVATASVERKPISVETSAIERKPMSRIRRVIAKNLARTRDELVLLTTFNEADMTAVKSLRIEYGENFKKSHGVKLGFMSFFLKASAMALQRFPEVNAYIDSQSDEIVYRKNADISVAVSTSRGLLTPVIRRVQDLSHAEIEKQIIDFARKAEDKSLLPEDLMGGSFTVTNGGIFGSMMSTPLPAPDQSAILGMHSIQDRPVVREGNIVIRPMMYLALSYDHRLIDGREAVGFLKSVKEAVEDPLRIFLEV